MNYTSRKTERLVLRVFGLVVVSFLVAPDVVQAQFENKWLAIGELHQAYRSSSNEQERWMAPQNIAFRFPGIEPRSGWQSASALWIGTTNWTSEDGEAYPLKFVHVGPRTQGTGEFFNVQFDLVGRFDAPIVTVDGFDTFDKPATLDRVDPGIPADRMIVSVANTAMGLTVERNIYAFDNEYHDNYHILEYTFTNTGNIDGDPEIELPDQTLENVYIYGIKRVNKDQIGRMPGNARWPYMIDIVGDGQEQYDVPYRALFSWVGNTINPPVDPLGGPIWTPAAWQQQADTLGRLYTDTFVGTVTIHADKSAADKIDDPSQPSTTGWVWNDSPITAAADQYDQVQMAKEWDLVTKGHMYPHHADLTDADGDFTTADGNPFQGQAGGFGYDYAYGPYTLGPGESITLVWADAADDLTEIGSVEIGKAFKASGWDINTPIEFRGTRLTKNQWFMTVRDSLFETFERAIKNYQSGMMIPRPPLPPSKFEVISGVDGIELKWDVFDGAAPPGGFEIYRAQNFFEGEVQKAFQYDLIYTAGPQERSFTDNDVARGVGYYYYIVSVGDVNQDATALTPTGVRLRSNRYYTQTYDPAKLKRAPGETLAEARIVPNPYNLASDKNVRWPDQQDQIAFLNIPGRSTIKIYTEMGELIRTIEHVDGSGDAYWDLTTLYHQIVATGVYLAVITDHETGDQVVKKFVIIR